MEHSRTRFHFGVVGGVVLALTMTILGMTALNTPAYAAEDAPYEVTFGHFSPFSDSLERSKVNVFIDGVQVASEVAYMEQVSVGVLAPGPYEIIVQPVHWSAGTITETVDLPPADAVGVVDPAILLAYAGGAADIWFHVEARAVETAPAPSGAKVRFVQLAPFSPEVSPPVDPPRWIGDSEYTVCSQAGTIFYGMTMVKYGQAGAYTTIPSGSYTVYLAGSHDEGCDGAHLTPDIVITLEEQSVADFIAVGTNVKKIPFANDMEILTITGQTGVSASVLDEFVYLPVMTH